MQRADLRHPYSLRGALWFCLLASAIAPVAARAQSSASVSGIVTDQSKAAVAGASVVLRNSETSLERSTVTGASGNYAIVNVAPGNYSVIVARQGFDTSQETQVVLAVDQAATFNFVLKVGSVQQSVTVSAEASEIQSSSASLGAVITTQSVNNLPLNGRNFTELLQLTPGVSRISVSQNASAGGTASNPVGQFTFPAVNGQRNRSNLFLLDGINNLGGYTGTYNYEPVIDAIQEFKVQSHSDLAEYGQATGGLVSVVTKSGTNTLHGSVWEFLRNSAFDARNYFLTKVNPLRQNQFGVAVGGPVMIPHFYNGRNKTFFFFDYEGFRQSQANGGLLITPTAAQLGGDFSNLLAKGVVIYNPFSTRPDPANPGQYLRDPFPNNKIPSNLISPAATLYASYAYPPPNTTGTSNLINTTGSRLNSGSYSGRIDQSFGQRDLLFGRVSQYNQPSSTPSNPYLINEATLNGYNIAVHEVHTFGPTAVLEGYFGRNTGVNDILLVFNHAPADFATALEQAGFSSAYIGGYAGGPASTIVPVITVTGYLGGSSVNNYQDLQFADTYEYGGSFSKIWGRHNIKVGGIIATNNFTMPIASATEATSSFQTSNLEHPTSPSGASTGDALASFLLGVPNNAQIRNTNALEHDGWGNGAYAQDQIQISPKLTLNVGVRWDVAVWAVNGYLQNGRGQGYIGTMDLTNGTYVISAQPPACSSTVGAPCIPGGALPANVVVTPYGNHALHNTDYGNWQPRVGFAYHPLNKTTILAGYGRVFDTWNSTTQYSQNLAGTWPSVGLLNVNSLNPTTPVALLGNPLSQGTGSVVTPAATPFNNATFYINPNFHTTYSDQWNASVQQGLGANTVFTVGYAGSHDGNVDFGALQNTAQYPAAGTAAQVASRRQYPYIVPTKWDNSVETADYNSLQTTLHKTTGNGLTYLLSYTWSKSIDVGCSDSFGAGCVVQNPYDPQADRSVSGFDLTNMFSGSLVYEIPFGIGRAYKSGNSLVNVVAGGWNLNSIATMTSGAPFSVVVNSDIANIGNTLVQANKVGNPMPQQRGAAEWFNPAAFQAPARYTFGNFGRNGLRSNWYRDLDLSVFKTFPLVRESLLEFRADAFNLTNTPVFAIPDNGVGDPLFGASTSTANTERLLQFALKIQF